MLADITHKEPEITYCSTEFLRHIAEVDMQVLRPVCQHQSCGQKAFQVEHTVAQTPHAVILTCDGRQH